MIKKIIIFACVAMSSLILPAEGAGAGAGTGAEKIVSGQTTWANLRDVPAGVVFLPRRVGDNFEAVALGTLQFGEQNNLPDRVVPQLAAGAGAVVKKVNLPGLSALVPQLATTGNLRRQRSSMAIQPLPRRSVVEPTPQTLAAPKPSPAAVAVILDTGHKEEDDESNAFFADQRPIKKDHDRRMVAYFELLVNTPNRILTEEEKAIVALYNPTAAVAATPTEGS